MSDLIVWFSVYISSVGFFYGLAFIWYTNVVDKEVMENGG